MLKRFIVLTVLVSVVGWTHLAHAQLAAGTWERTDAQGKGLTMTVEPCCNGGLRLIYQVPANPANPGQPAMAITIDSPMDGSEVPALIGGKPTGQTMAIKRIDNRNYTAEIKMAGKPVGTARASVSADGKTLTVESTMQPGADGKPQKFTETWVRK